MPCALLLVADRQEPEAAVAVEAWVAVDNTDAVHSKDCGHEHMDYRPAAAAHRPVAANTLEEEAHNVAVVVLVVNAVHVAAVAVVVVGRCVQHCLLANSTSEQLVATQMEGVGCCLGCTEEDSTWRNQSLSNVFKVHSDLMPSIVRQRTDALSHPYICLVPQYCTIRLNNSGTVRL